MSFAAMFAFVFTQRASVLWTVIAIAFAIYFLQAYLRKRPSIS
jgi:hypothetical protein